MGLAGVTLGRVAPIQLRSAAPDRWDMAGMQPGGPRREEITATVGSLAVSYVFRARGHDGLIELFHRVDAEHLQRMLAHPDLRISYAEAMAPVDAAGAICDETDIGYRLGEEAARVMYEQGRLQSFRDRSFSEMIEVLVDLLNDGSELRRMRIETATDTEAFIESTSDPNAAGQDRFLCRFGTGFLTAVPAYLGRTGVAHEVACVCQGADACHFVVRWQPPRAGVAVLPGEVAVVPHGEVVAESVVVDTNDREELASILEQVVEGLPLPQHVAGIRATLETEAGGELVSYTRGDTESPAGSSFTAPIDGAPGLHGTTTIVFTGRGLPAVDQLLAEASAQQIGRVLADVSAIAELHERARRDPLTGLANRAQLEELAATVGEGTAVVFVDLDGFKAVNDGHGHVAGDVLLGQVGARLRDAVRTSDLVARYGGDEFVALVAGTQSAADAELVARKLLTVFDAPFDLGDQELALGASSGVARAPDDGTTLADLVAAADRRMYRDKHARR